MVAFAHDHDDRPSAEDRAAILLVALENAIGVLVADDNLLSIVDPHYSGTPDCIEQMRSLVEKFRS